VSKGSKLTDSRRVQGSFGGRIWEIITGERMRKEKMEWFY